MTLLIQTYHFMTTLVDPILDPVKAILLSQTNCSKVDSESSHWIERPAPYELGFLKG